MRHARPLAVTILLASAGGSLAFAQGAKPADSGTANAPSASAQAAPSASDSNAQPPRPMAGYSYSDPKPQKGQQKAPAPKVVHHPPAPAKSTGPVATLPGFEILGDGSTRVFVQLTQTVPVEERKAKGTLTYVLKGARVTIHNNTNPLVTVHFNTPVNQARLRPAGNDLLLVIDLRVETTPAWKMTTAKDGGAILQIDFPKGNFLPEAREKS